MIINGNTCIKTDGGDYILLADYGSDGLCVVSQSDIPEDAI